MAKRAVANKANQLESTAFAWRDENNSVPRLTTPRARELVNMVLQIADDEAAAALVELVTGVAYERDVSDRDDLALWVAHEAYSLTGEFSRAAERFATRAATRHQNLKEVA